MQLTHDVDDSQSLAHLSRQFWLVKFLVLVCPLSVVPRVSVVVNQNRRRILHLGQQFLGRNATQNFRKLGVDFFT